MFEVDALDPLTFVGVPLVLRAAALSQPGCRPGAPAGSVPSRRSRSTECRPTARQVIPVTHTDTPCSTVRFRLDFQLKHRYDPLC